MYFSVFNSLDSLIFFWDRLFCRLIALLITAMLRFLILILHVCIAVGFSQPKVAVIGTTGKLGREAVQQLVEQGIPVKCLVRNAVEAGVEAAPASIKDATDSKQVAAYLSTLPGVELVQGDITNIDSLHELLKDCTACLDFHGATAPKPWYRALIPLAYPESTPTHPKQVNYVGVQYLIAAAESSEKCRRVVRITGKGEEPFSFFSILINLLGGMAKAWNNQAEGLFRSSAIDYTIVRPGVMKDTVKGGPNVLALKDNGGDLKTSAVSYSQIADLCIQSLQYDQCKRSTLTVMNVEENGSASYGPLLEQVQSDSRDFPDMFSQHQFATRLGGGMLFLVVVLMVKTTVSAILGLLSLIFR